MRRSRPQVSWTPALRAFVLAEYEKGVKCKVLMRMTEKSFGVKLGSFALYSFISKERTKSKRHTEEKERQLDRIAVHCLPEMGAEVRSLAKSRGWSVSHTLRKAIKCYLNGEKNES